MLKACFEIDKSIQQNKLDVSLTILRDLVLIYLKFYYESKDKETALINDISKKIGG